MGRLSRLLGEEFASSALEISFEAGGLSMRGFLAPPGAARARSDLQLLFVNGRSVRDDLVRHAVRVGFGDTLAGAAYPAFVLHLEIEPGAVDVNVHPTKHEIRFREPRHVHDFVRHAISRALGGCATQTPPETAPLALEAGAPAADAAVRRPQGAGLASYPIGGARPGAGRIREHLAAYTALSPAPRASGFGSPRGQVRLGDYVLVDDRDRLLLIDLTAGRRALVRERLDHSTRMHDPVSRPLLIPHTQPVSETAADAVDEASSALRSLGIEVRRGAPGALTLRSMPACLAGVAPETLLDAVAGMGADVGCGGRSPRHARRTCPVAPVRWRYRRHRRRRPCRPPARGGGVRGRGPAAAARWHGATMTTRRIPTDVSRRSARHGGRTGTASNGNGDSTPASRAANGAADSRDTGPVVFLMGPTAAGKTEIAATLAERGPFEIVSVDSALVFRHLNIGTGKPDRELLARAPHRLIDIRDPDERYSAAEFREDAMRAIEAVRGSGGIPLLTGGTGLYFRALEKGLAVLPPANSSIRSEIERRAILAGWPAMHALLARVDPQSAGRIHPNDPQRIERALEVHELTGRPMSGAGRPRSPWRAFWAGVPYCSRTVGSVRAPSRYRRQVHANARHGAD